MWIVIKIKDPSCVYEWRLQVSYRIGILSQQLYVLFLSKNSYSISPTSLTIPAKKLQAEIAMRAEGKPGMSDEEVCIPYHIHLIQEHPSCFLPSIIFDCWKNCQNSGSGFWGFLQVQDFVSRYLPAYNAYLPTLYSEGPNGSDLKRLLVIEIDEGRNPF